MVLERYSIIGLAFGLILIFTGIILLRKRKIPGKTFVVWFIIGVLVCAVSTTPFFLSLLRGFLGAEYAISAIVATGFSFFLILFFYLNYKISELQSQLMKLTMQTSVNNYAKKHIEQNKTNPNSGQRSENS